ncbi:DoxX family protein [Sphingobacterium corticis]|uniref:DoxX family protein n=1 Tax=Sphingobacterium corticis TaxID=1812823 RepID=A0ABW5NIL4_9SPHI
MSTDSSIGLERRFFLRVAILFIAFISLPVHKDFYQTLFTISWSSLIPDLFNLLTYLPHYFGKLNGFYDWGLILFIALIGAFVWLKAEKGRPEALREFRYYYYLRIFVRFKLAAILLVAGFIKLFPLFAPQLSLSHLNTAYGQFEDWKHLLLSLSAAPAYLVFLGVVELLAASLLLFRKTSFLAVVFIIPFYGNAFLADVAYQGPTYFASAYVVLLTLPIFLYDVQRLGSLVLYLKPTNPSTNRVNWSDSSLFLWRQVGKLVFAIVFFGLVGIRAYQIHSNANDSLHYPQHAGLPAVEGKYVADEFVWNGDTLQYSPTDTIRWKDVVFEKWNTLSIRREAGNVHHAVSEGLFQRATQKRDYEHTHTGDRLYYRYTVKGDSLHLKNPNDQYTQDVYRLHIERPDSAHIRLSGANLRGDSLSVSLTKTNKKYLLEEIKKSGRRSLGYKL